MATWIASGRPSVATTRNETRFPLRTPTPRSVALWRPNASAVTRDERKRSCAFASTYVKRRLSMLNVANAVRAAARTVPRPETACITVLLAPLTCATGAVDGSGGISFSPGAEAGVGAEPPPAAGEDPPPADPAALPPVE